MYQKLNVPTLGLIENMSHFVCPTCHHESDIFGKGGGEMLAEELSVPFLGRIPLYEPIRRGGDTGVPIVVGEPTSPAALAFRTAAERLAAQISIAAYNASQIKKPIALTPVRLTCSLRFTDPIHVHRSTTASTSSCTRTTAVRSSP